MINSFSNVPLDTKGLWSIGNNGVLIAGDQKLTHQTLLKKMQDNGQLNPAKDKKLKEACKSFESFFMAYLMKAMDKTVERQEKGIFSDSRPQQYYRDMMYDGMSQDIAKRGMGLADMLYKQVSQSLLNQVYKPDLTK